VLPSPSPHSNLSLVLGVQTSATERTWCWRLPPQNDRLAQTIAQRHGLPDVLARVVAGRGISLENVEAFLKPRLRDVLPDPDTLQDMEKATSILTQAILHKTPVAIFGDYDVDGACSSALLAEYMGNAGVPYQLHIPDRIVEGYGPNSDRIRILAENGAKILITVDCGTSAHAPLDYAKQLGLTVIVLDHHQPSEVLPEVDALVNPNRLDDTSNLGHLCAAGVVFMTLVALNRALRPHSFWPNEPDLMESLDCVALATVADVMPLTGINRAFVHQGLAVMHRRERLGLATLSDMSGLKQAPQAWHLGYVLGPRINAGGRIGDSSLGARLLLCQDADECQRMAALLEHHNRERQTLEQVCVAEGMAQAERLVANNPEQSTLVLSDTQWHLGLIGLIASRVKDRFRLPTFAFAPREMGGWSGSGRSLHGVDLGSAVATSVQLGITAKGGGHVMAAGVSLATTEDLAPFATFLEETLSASVQSARAEHLLKVDALLSAGGATPELVAALEQASPFGSGNSEPLFAFRNMRVKFLQSMGHAQPSGHLRATLESADGESVSGVAFRVEGTPLGDLLQEAARDNMDRRIHVVGTLSLNVWGGRTKVDLKITDAAWT
jgi:single-stranded-DNA-specific exonuclease